MKPNIQQRKYDSHKSHAEENGNTDFRSAVDIHLPEHGDGQQSEDPVRHGTDAAVYYRRDRDYVVIHTGACDTRNAHRTLPEIIRRETLECHQKEVHNRYQPNDGYIDPNGPFLPWLSCQPQDENGNRRSNET